MQGLERFQRKVAGHARSAWKLTHQAPFLHYPPNPSFPTSNFKSSSSSSGQNKWFSQSKPMRNASSPELQMLSQIYRCPQDLWQSHTIARGRHATLLPTSVAWRHNSFEGRTILSRKLTGSECSDWVSRGLVWSEEIFLSTLTPIKINWISTDLCSIF